MFNREWNNERDRKAEIINRLYCFQERMTWFLSFSSDRNPIACPSLSFALEYETHMKIVDVRRLIFFRAYQ